MTWDRIEVNKMPEGRPWVKIGVHCRRDGYNQMKITLSRSLVKHLGAAPGDKLEVYMGTGDHDGWIAAAVGGDGFTLTDYRQGHGNLSLRMSSRFFGVYDKHPTSHITGESLVMDVGKDGRRWLYVELPEWAYNATAAGAGRVEVGS